MTDPLITAAQFLRSQLDWLRHSRNEQGEPVAIGVFREIGECAARIRSLVEGPREQRYLGPCGAPIVPTTCDHPYGDGLICGVCGGDVAALMPADGICQGDVYGVPGAEKGRCKTCGATVDQESRRIWLGEQVGDSDLAWTASGIADALNLNPKTVRAWATERRSETGHLLRAAKLGTFWRNADGQLIPWVDPPAHLFEVERRAQIKARGDRLHYVADVRQLATEAAERRAENEAAQARREADHTVGVAD